MKNKRKLNPIIKSKERYKLIKMPEGINLGDYKYEARYGEVGVSTEVFGNRWEVSPQGKVLGKN